MKSDLDIHSSWKTRASGQLLGWLIRLIGITLRREVKGDLARFNAHPSPLIHALWHNQILVSPYLWRKMFPKRPCVVLTSASKDGAILAAAVKVFGVGAVHGSSSRRGVAALIALKNAAKAGKDLVFTPDGPRGPRYQLQPGVVKIAQSSGAPILPLHFEYLSSWRLKTWDAFHIPKPFSKVIIILRDPIVIPKVLDQEAFEEQRKHLETALLTGITDLTENHGKPH